MQSQMANILNLLAPTTPAGTQKRGGLALGAGQNKGANIGLFTGQFLQALGQTQAKTNQLAQVQTEISDAVAAPTPAILGYNPVATIAASDTAKDAVQTIMNTRPHGLTAWNLPTQQDGHAQAHPNLQSTTTQQTLSSETSGQVSQTQIAPQQTAAQVTDAVTGQTVVNSANPDIGVEAKVTVQSQANGQSTLASATGQNLVQAGQSVNAQLAAVQVDSKSSERVLRSPLDKTTHVLDWSAPKSNEAAPLATEVSAKQDVLKNKLPSAASLATNKLSSQTNVIQTIEPTTDTVDADILINQNTTTAGKEVSKAASFDGQLDLSVVEQVKSHIEKAVQNKNQRITVQLDPAELGKVEVKIDYHTIDNQRHAKIAVSAERLDTLHLLQKDAGDLVRNLQNSGIQADSNNIDFNLRQQGQQQTAFDWQNHQNNQQHNGAEHAQDEVIGIDVNTAVHAQLMAANGQVDLVI